MCIKWRNLVQCYTEQAISLEYGCSYVVLFGVCFAGGYFSELFSFLWYNRRHHLQKCIDFKSIWSRYKMSKLWESILSSWDRQFIEFPPAHPPLAKKPSGESNKVWTDFQAPFLPFYLDHHRVSKASPACECELNAGWSHKMHPRQNVWSWNSSSCRPLPVSKVSVL